MFRSQFKLTAKQCRGLRDLCIFFAIIYVKAWTTASRSAEAHLNDLELLKSLQAYSAINKRISDATVNKFKGHLWYLSEHLVGLALFDDNVSAQTKDEMVAAMTNKEGEESPLKRVNIDLRSLNCARLLILRRKTPRRSSPNSACHKIFLIFQRLTGANLLNSKRQRQL